MKPIVSLILLLAPLHPGIAALLFDSEPCCLIDTASDRADNLNERGARMYAAGDYANARTTLEEALRIQSKESPNLDTLAGTLYNLAAVARMQSRLPEAEALYNRSIAVRESLTGPDSPALAHPLAGLALVTFSEGRTAQAVALAERAVRLSGNRPEDPKLLAIARNTLATILLSQGQSARAESLEQSVVDELKRTAATGTPEFVNAMTNLGTARMRQKNYRQADVDLHEAEAAALSVAGPNHPMTATIWNNLGKVRMAQSDWRAAETLFGKAIESWRKALGPTHPDVAYGISNLAAVYQSRKRYAEAERLFQQALEIDDAALGADSLKVANDWNNLGALSVVQHHYGDAERELSKGLAIAERKVGMEHPDTAAIAVNLAVVYFSKARYDDAAALFARSLPVKERVLGPDSPELASILRLYSTSLKASRNYVEAEKAELKATRITTHNALLAGRL